VSVIFLRRGGATAGSEVEGKGARGRKTFEAVGLGTRPATVKGRREGEYGSGRRIHGRAGSDHFAGHRPEPTGGVFLLEDGVKASGWAPLYSELANGDLCRTEGKRSQIL